MINIKIKKALIAAVIAAASMGYPNISIKAEETGIKEMYRLYNPNSGEHFYTAKAKERDNLVKLGWKDEGIGWFAPEKSESPVYRLYNKYGGEHHYTLNEAEKDALVKAGWTDEGIGWYSDDEKIVPVFREYNPNAQSCNHNYTINYKEHEALEKDGWNDEGIGWYGTEEDIYLHFYQYEDIRVYSIFNDKRVRDEDGMETDALLYLISEDTSIDLNAMDISEYESYGFHSSDDLIRLAECVIQRDQENHSVYSLDNYQIEEIGESFVRMTRTITYPSNEYYEGSSQFEVSGLFRRNGTIYILNYSCDKAKRSDYEYIFNYCLGKSLN